MMTAKHDLQTLSVDELIERLPSLTRAELRALKAKSSALDAALGSALREAISNATSAMSTPSAPPTPATESDEGDRALTASEVADRLGFTVDYVYRHAAGFHFAKRVGSRWRFSAKGLNEYLRDKRA